MVKLDARNEILQTNDYDQRKINALQQYFVIKIYFIPFRSTVFTSIRFVSPLSTRVLLSLANRKRALPLYIIAQVGGGSVFLQIKRACQSYLP